MPYVQVICARCLEPVACRLSPDPFRTEVGDSRFTNPVPIWPRYPIGEFSPIG